MRSLPFTGRHLRKPQLLLKACRLNQYLQTLSPAQLSKAMKISMGLAQKTHELIAKWTDVPESQTMASDSFLGDIYSGLQVQDFSSAERDYADHTLFILSGLYGVLRPYDGICPYRLEMGYKFPDPAFSDLYKYWGHEIAACLPDKGLIVNLASEEYVQTVTPFVDASRIVSPKFLTLNPKTGEPTFVVVHAKIARGAFAHWLIKTGVDDAEAFTKFNDLNYKFHKELTTPQNPVFVCEEFGGKGLSIKKLV